MKKRHLYLLSSLSLLLLFVIWTLLIQHIDVQTVSPHQSSVGFAALNVWFHNLTSVHWKLYTITDWLGLVPIFICMCFGLLGLTQWIHRRHILHVDADILLLGGYYLIVIFAYLIFEMIPINYRPVLIDGFLEASYPSSTTLLVLCVMPTLKYQADRRISSHTLQRACQIFVFTFSAMMVLGRLISGVHWLTDIIGSILLSSGLFILYIYAVERFSNTTKGDK